MSNYEMEIEQIRQQLIKAAQLEGLHAERTIDLSRKLDTLINLYEEQKANKKINKM